MKTYSIRYQYSRNGGSSWGTDTVLIKAESDMAAIAQVQSKYPLVKDIKILSVR